MQGDEVVASSGSHLCHCMVNIHQASCFVSITPHDRRTYILAARMQCESLHMYTYIFLRQKYRSRFRNLQHLVCISSTVIAFRGFLPEFLYSGYMTIRVIHACMHDVSCIIRVKRGSFWGCIYARYLEDLVHLLKILVYRIV
jgi:hypothetical protein